MADRSKRRRLLLATLLLLALWLATGIRPVGPESYGVLDGPLGPTLRVDGSWALAPPGLLRLTLYPRRAVELDLPDAERAMLPAVDGSRFGFRGWVTVRPRIEAWRRLHQACAGMGLDHALLSAIRTAAEGLSRGSESGHDPTRLARDLERGLGESLTELGLDLRRVSLEGVDFLAVQEGSRSEPTDARVLVVGLDGLDWEIVDPLMRAGRLPNLSRLVQDGVRAKLLSISPLLSPVVWTTVATGVEPSRHGILDFLVDDREGQSRQPVTSAQRRVPTVWEILSRTGVEVGVTGWWATWPADAVRGYLVSDRIAYQLFGYRADPTDARGKTWPPELYEQVRPLVVEPDDVPWTEVEPYLDGPRRQREEFDADERQLLDEFRTLLASGKTYLQIAQQLRRQFQPQLEVAYFEGTDTVGHLFMPYRPPALPNIDSGRQASFSRIVDRYYEAADGYLGELLEERDERWTVLVVSDHGFASDTTRPLTTDSRIGHGAAADWHRRFGVLILSGAGIRAGERLEEASVYDIAPTILALFGQPVPRSWPGKVLADALLPSFLEGHPVRYRLDDPLRDDLRAEHANDPAAADLLSKLESLGYVSAAGDSGGSLSARNNAGVALLAEGRYEEAEQEFRAGLGENPGAEMLKVNLGLALRLQGRNEEAAAGFRGVLDSPATRRMAGHMLGQILLEQGRLDEAETLLREVLEREPGAAEIRTVLGQTLELRGEIAAAEAEYRVAADLDPDAAMPRNYLGSLARRRRDLEAAADWYQRAIEADPYFMGAYNNLALVYQDLGRMDQARDLYSRALAKAPRNAEVLNNLASWYYARGELEEARTYWMRSAAADPRYPSPLNNLAGIEITAKRYDEAERLLRQALTLDPDYGDARINLALILGVRGELEASRVELERATLDPRTGVNSFVKLGALELQLARPEQAAGHLEHARKMAPSRTDLLNYLGEAYRQLGRTDEAVGVWRRSLELDPSQNRLREYLERSYPDPT